MNGGPLQEVEREQLYADGVAQLVRSDGKGIIALLHHLLRLPTEPSPISDVAHERNNVWLAIDVQRRKADLHRQSAAVLPHRFQLEAGNRAARSVRSCWMGLDFCVSDDMGTPSRRWRGTVGTGGSA
jgi:hypothetical protein